MRQYTRQPVTKEDVNLLAKELDFCFDQKGSMYFLTKYCEELGKSGVWHNSKSLEEISDTVSDIYEEELPQNQIETISLKFNISDR